MMRTLYVLLCAALVAAVPGLAESQSAYPTKPVRMIVPFPPGGGNDLLARIIGQKLGDTWGQPVIIDNKPGGNTIVGTEALARAAPDGYTLMLTSSSHVIIPSLLNLPFDAIKDFAPVTTVSLSELVLAVNPEVPAKTVRELIALAKSKPGQLNFASGGSGNPNHLAGEMFNSVAGTKVVHVPYKGGGPALTDLVGGQVQMFFVASAVVLPFLKTGKLNALAISGGHRLAALPDVPTFTEAGLPNFDVGQWYAILAPAGTPKPVIDKVAADVAKALALPDVKEKLAAQGMEPFVTSPAQLGELMNKDLARYAKLIKSADIKMEQ
jgi:tripartite-type tricarboxylate transporter receptor subunit TctC